MYKRQVYFSDWQAALTPEFQMQAQSHKIYINADIAEQAGVQKGQWCHASFSLTNTKMQLISQSVISQVNIVNNLPDNLVFGNFALCQPLLSPVAMSITLASEQEVIDYLLQFNDNIMQAKQSKKAILAKLKVQDQTIPIRLFSGGLNDG